MLTRQHVRIGLILLAQLGLVAGFYYLGRLEVTYITEVRAAGVMIPNRLSTTTTCGYPITWALRKTRYEGETPFHTWVIDRPLAPVAAGLVVVALPAAIGGLLIGRGRRWLAVTAIAGTGGLIAASADDFVTGRVGIQDLPWFVPMPSAEANRLERIEMDYIRPELGQFRTRGTRGWSEFRVRMTALGLLVGGVAGMALFRPWRRVSSDSPTTGPAGSPAIPANAAAV